MIRDEIDEEKSGQVNGGDLERIIFRKAVTCRKFGTGEAVVPSPPTATDGSPDTTLAFDCSRPFRTQYVGRG